MIVCNFNPSPECRERAKKLMDEALEKYRETVRRAMQQREEFLRRTYPQPEQEGTTVVLKVPKEV